MPQKDKIALKSLSSDNSLTNINIKRNDTDDSYVQFKTADVHEYSYPNLDFTKSRNSDGNSKEIPDMIESFTKDSSLIKNQNPPLPSRTIKANKTYDTHLLPPRTECQYCKEIFNRSDNPKGSCEEAPDCGMTCIETVSCLCCPRSVLFHCMSDEEHNYDLPCVCDASDERNCTKWTVLALLSIFVPCLWCYLPLMACHKCGRKYRCCGGRHKENNSV
jgi:sprouty-related EVH1 domain-containing protein